MSYISAKESIGKAAGLAIESAKKILQSKGIEVDEKLMQVERKKLVAIGSKYYNIMYWSVNTNVPTDGEYKGSTTYFYLYIAKRTRHNSRNPSNQIIPVLYIIPKNPETKKEC